jgi:hypothetical protein
MKQFRSVCHRTRKKNLVLWHTEQQFLKNLILLSQKPFALARQYR